MAKEKIVRAQTRREELANTLSHGLGALLALAGAVPLLVRGLAAGSAKTALSLTAYGFSLVLLYTASAVYHGVRNPDIKRVLRVMDHCSIFVLILGTYIPMSLPVGGGRPGGGWGRRFGGGGRGGRGHADRPDGKGHSLH